MQANYNRKMEKVENLCKFCSQPVTARTGLRCQGICERWAHYKCLFNTPDEDTHLKSGYIESKTSCPNCDLTPVKKGLLIKPPLPANQVYILDPLMAIWLNKDLDAHDKCEASCSCQGSRSKGRDLSNQAENILNLEHGGNKNSTGDHNLQVSPDSKLFTESAHIDPDEPVIETLENLVEIVGSFEKHFKDMLDNMKILILKKRAAAADGAK